MRNRKRLYNQTLLQYKLTAFISPEKNIVSCSNMFNNCTDNMFKCQEPDGEKNLYFLRRNLYSTMGLLGSLNNHIQLLTDNLSVSMDNVDVVEKRFKEAYDKAYNDGKFLL